jgi:uncharacterized caspase-like protein
LPIAVLAFLLDAPAAGAQSLQIILDSATGDRVGIPTGLVVGEAHQLATAVNDAKMLAATLKGMGFEVILGEDLSRTQFYQQWHQFLTRVEPDSFAAFFFAGHGVQVDGTNWLLPTDAPNLAQAQDGLLKRVSINFTELMEELRAAKPRISLLILDACRNNPYAAGTPAVAGTRGLARIDAAKGSFVMYSADAGETAWDRLPDDPSDVQNSVYTRRLIPLLTAPGLTLQSVAMRVRADVQQLVSRFGGNQTPAYYDGIVGSVCLSGTCGEAKAQP